MYFRINETQMLKAFVYRPLGKRYETTKEILEACGVIGKSIIPDYTDSCYRISAGDYEWWSNYFIQMHEDSKVADILRRKYGSVVDQIIREEWRRNPDDYMQHHKYNKRAFNRIINLMEKERANFNAR